jgi:hypothetical protein
MIGIVPTGEQPGTLAQGVAAPYVCAADGLVSG